MTDEQFDDLVDEFEDQLRCNPTSYRFKVSLLAMLGNVYVSAILLFFFALLAALIVSIKWLNWIAAKPIGLVWVFLCLVLRPLWGVRIEPPAGIEITADQAPELFATLNELRSKLGAPRFDHVLITEELNATTLQLPRLGIFGWYRNYLIIGMPLMKSLTCEQFKAVLAHEFGHLAKGHGILSQSIYRQRLRWSRLMGVLEATESKGSFLFMPFLNWFVPYFGAFSFPVARANEYEADAISLRLTSSRATAEALTSIEVVGGYLTDLYWPLIDADFGEESQPNRKPYSEMSHAFATRLNRLTSALWLGPAMARPTTSEDTHPALSERLSAIGEEPSFSPPEPGQAADALLAPSLEATINALDGKWKDNILSTWEQRHQEIQEARRRLVELNEKHVTGVDLTLEEAYERAELTESIGKNADAALVQFRALHESAPDDARICLALGSRLMMRNDGTGCSLVERALQFDEDHLLKGLELLCDYHWRNDHTQEFHAWNQRLIEQSELQNAAHKERIRVTLGDKFEPHGLSEETLAELVAQLRAVSGLRAAYFMRKHVMHFQDRPLYVLGYRVAGLFSSQRSKRATEALERIENSVQFPGQTLFINVDGDNYQFRRKFRRMRHTKILRTPSSVAMTIIKTAFKKLFGVLAVLLGIFMALIVLNDIFRFTLLIEPKDSGLGLSAARLLMALIIATVGTKWLIDPID